MNNPGKLFSDDINSWLIDEAWFNQSKFKMSVYYKYEPYGSKLFVLSYVDDCVYWYKYEGIEKWFVDTLGKRFHVNLLRYSHWFMSIRKTQLKYNSISVDQSRYDTSVVAKYLDSDIIKEN